jgi:hypothetical protein
MIKHSLICLSSSYRNDVTVDAGAHACECDCKFCNIELESAPTSPSSSQSNRLSFRPLKTEPVENRPRERFLANPFHLSPKDRTNQEKERQSHERSNQARR